MKKEEIKKIVILLLLFIFSVFLVVLGIIKYNEGYGTDGESRVILNNIVDEFNNLNDIKKSNKYIKAKYEDKKIIVSYIENANDYELNYKYVNTSQNKYLSLIYTDDNKEIAEMISKYLIEVSSSINGSTYGDIFSNYTYNNLYLTNKEEYGICVYKESNQYILEFQLNINIYNVLKNKFNEEDNYDYIIPINIKNIIDEININNLFKYEKNSLYLYAYSDNDYYYIYISDKNNNTNNIYRSIMSTIKVLNVKLYNDIKDTTETFNKNQNKVGYSVNINPNLSDELKSLKRSFTLVTIKK